MLLQECQLCGKRVNNLKRHKAGHQSIKETDIYFLAEEKETGKTKCVAGGGSKKWLQSELSGNGFLKPKVEIESFLYIRGDIIFGQII